MKTPSFLLLLLAASFASFASSQVTVEGRCAKGKAVLEQMSRSAIPDSAPYLKTEKNNGYTRTSIDVDKAPDLCDATVWRYFIKKSVAGQPPAWRDASLRDIWNNSGVAQQAEMIQTIDDVYRGVDAQAPALFASADAVVDAAVKLGVATKTAGAAPAGLAASGVALAKFAGIAPYTVAAAEAKAAPSPADLKASLTFLLADPPAPKPAKGQKAAPAASKEPVLGPGVLAFRKAVVGLASDLAVAQAAHKFYPGPGAMYAAAAKITGKGYPDSVANETSYRGALKYLTDPAITDAGDEGEREGAALSRLDLALRNLIAIRAAAVDAAVAAAKAGLKGRTVKETLAGVEHAAKEEAKPAKPAAAPANELAAAVLEKLKGTKEYGDLNALYDNNKNNAVGAEAKAQMDKMAADAAATGIVKAGKGQALQYSVGGQKVTDTGILVADLKTDKDYRDFIASAVAANIATDGKVSAVIAALKGRGASGDPIVPAPKPDEQAAAGQLPPKVEKPEPKPASAWESLVKATPGAGFFGFLSSKETAERYASHVNEEASESAAAAARTRAAKEYDLNWSSAEADRVARAAEERKVAASAAQAKADAEKIRRTPQDPDLSPAEAKRQQDAAVAARQQAAADEQKKIRDDAAAAKVKRDAEAAEKLKAAQAAAAKAKADADAKMKALDETVNKAYDDGIAKSELVLHADYKAKGNDRRLAAERASGYTGDFYRTERVDKFFGDVWEGDKLAAKTAVCKKQLGFKLPVGAGEGFKDPSVDNLDSYCLVRKELVGHLSSYRGKVGAPAPAPEEAKK